MTELAEYAPLQFAESTLNITMEYNGDHGRKGYAPGSTGFTHNIFAKKHNNTRELNVDSIPGGAIPVSNYYGKKVQVVTLEGYFPYRYPDDFWNVFMAALSPYLYLCVPKNIFLCGSVIQVSKNVTFPDLPVGSYWYIKRYTYKRGVDMPEVAGFNLVLWRWYNLDIFE